MKTLPLRLSQALVSGSILGALLAFAIFESHQSLYAQAPLGVFRGNSANRDAASPPAPVTTLSATADTDRDGLPNTWETTCFHNPAFAADAGADFDFDGLTATQELELSNTTGGTYGNLLGKYALTTIAPPFGEDCGWKMIRWRRSQRILLALNGMT